MNVQRRKLLGGVAPAILSVTALAGAAGSGAPAGLRNGAWRHGGRTIQAVAMRRVAGALVREARRLVGLVG